MENPDDPQLKAKNKEVQQIEDANRHDRPQTSSGIEDSNKLFSSSQYRGLEYQKLGDVQNEVLAGVDILAPVMVKDVRADEGEKRVVSGFELLGHRSEVPMFIICAYQYNNYLNKLR